jgi:hypothetical protein
MPELKTATDLKAELARRDTEWNINPANRIKIHSSHIKTFLMCPAKFFFQYVSNIKAPRSSALVLGLGVHWAAELNLGQKKESHADLPEADVVGRFEEFWDAANQEPVIYDEEQGKGEVLDIGVACTRSLARVVMPAIQPAEVELKMEAQITNRDFDVAGRLDCLSDKKRVHDFKTTGAYCAKDQVGNYLPFPGDKIQMTQYKLMGGAAKLDLSGGIELNYILKKIPKTKGDLPKISNAAFAPTADHEAAFLRISDRVVEAVKRNSFVPNPTCFICSPEKCGYWEHCRGGAIF